MLAWVRTIFSVFQGLLEIWRAVGAYIESRKQAKAEEKSNERTKAAEDVKRAQTEEEFDEASDRLHDNSKRS